MKYYIFVSLVIFVGCIGIKRNIPEVEISSFPYAPPVVSCEAYLKEQLYKPLRTMQLHEQVFLEGSHLITWNPGDYTNFVAVASVDLLMPVNQWSTWTETQNTYFPFEFDGPQRFFALYGTNLITGESAWAGAK